MTISVTINVPAGKRARITKPDGTIHSVGGDGDLSYPVGAAWPGNPLEVKIEEEEPETAAKGGGNGTPPPPEGP